MFCQAKTSPSGLYFSESSLKKLLEQVNKVDERDRYHFDPEKEETGKNPVEMKSQKTNKN